MTHILLNTESGHRTPLKGPYTVNGKPGELPAHIIQLQVVDLPPPAVTATEALHPTETIDLAAGTLTRGWQVVELPPIQPETLTPRQLRLWLLGAGITLASVEAHLTSDAARVEWEYAAEIRRDHPLVAQLAQALGLTDVEVDEAFRVASQI